MNASGSKGITVRRGGQMVIVDAMPKKIEEAARLLPVTVPKNETVSRYYKKIEHLIPELISRGVARYLYLGDTTKVVLTIAGENYFLVRESK